MIDVSSLRALDRRWASSVPEPQKKAHRALADCREALAELRRFRALWKEAPDDSEDDAEQRMAELQHKVIALDIVARQLDQVLTVERREWARRLRLPCARCAEKP